MNQSPNKNYFTMPNEIFSLGLDASEIAVYAYLRCLENRRTYQCAELHHHRQRRWPRKEHGHAICRRARRERTHLHRANLCPDAFRHQEERQPALHHPADP